MEQFQLIEFETTNFRFQIIMPQGATDTQIKRRLKDGVRRHCRQTGGDYSLLKDWIDGENYNVIPMKMNTVYRDGETV